MTYKIYILILTMILTSCTASNIKQGDTSLSDNEGVLITRIHTNVTNLHTFLKIEGSTGYTSFSPLDSPIDFRAIKVNAGKAKFYRISRGILETWRKTDDYFTIEPGKINYIGDFVIEWINSDGNLGIVSGHVDKENETITEAKKLYPELFNKYQYVKNIPTARLKEKNQMQPKALPPITHTPNVSTK